MTGVQTCALPIYVRIEAVKIAARRAGRSGECEAVLNATNDTDVPVVLQALDGLSTACKATEPLLARLHVLADSLLDSNTTVAWQTGARALTAAEVEQTVQDFIDGAVRSQKAGFHGVELHGAHGYLICQFLSSELNVRTDHYGGSLENRSRFLFEIVEGVRKACPGLALGVRLSPERFGMKIPEIAEVYGRLVDAGVDLIDMSLWDVFKQPVDEQQGAFAGKNLTEIFAELPRGNTRLGVSGKIHDPADVQRVLDLGVDVAVLGRVAILHRSEEHTSEPPVT